MSEDTEGSRGSRRKFSLRTAAVAAAGAVGLTVLLNVGNPSAVELVRKPPAAGPLVPPGLRPFEIPTPVQPDYKNVLSGGEYVRMAYSALTEKTLSGGTRSFVDLLKEQGLEFKFSPLEEPFPLKTTNPETKIPEYPLPQVPINTDPTQPDQLPAIESGSKRVYAFVLIGKEVFMLVSPNIQTLDDPSQVDAPNKKGEKLVLPQYVLWQSNIFDFPPEIIALLEGFKARHKNLSKVPA